MFRRFLWKLVLLLLLFLLAAIAWSHLLAPSETLDRHLAASGYKVFYHFDQPTQAQEPSEVTASKADNPDIDAVAKEEPSSTLHNPLEEQLNQAEETKNAEASSAEPTEEQSTDFYGPMPEMPQEETQNASTPAPPIGETAISSEPSLSEAKEENNIPADAAASPPEITLVITGLGLSSFATEKALELPTSVVLGFSPYAYQLPKWIATAHDKGFNTAIEVPMEPTDYPMSDPGPHALLSTKTPASNGAALDWVLSQSKEIDGLYTPRDEKFTFHMSSAHQFLQTFKKQHLPLVYGNGKTNEEFLSLTKDEQIHTLHSPVFIDDTVTKEAILASLEDIEDQALLGKHVLAMGKPYPITIDLIIPWIASLPHKGIKLVTLRQENPDAAAPSGSKLVITPH